ncbi:MAG: divalent-cation tolerance protein CutA [Gammaproteobacteria bacterium]
MAVRLVLTTCPDAASAADIARALVERRLAACVTRLAGAVSVYRWQDTIEEAEEVQLLIKTTVARMPALMAALAELHPYDEPEILAFDAAGGSPGYLAWIEAMTEKTE